jgi:hypothetical protein
LLCRMSAILRGLPVYCSLPAGFVDFLFIPEPYFYYDK